MSETDPFQRKPEVELGDLLMDKQMLEARLKKINARIKELRKLIPKRRR